MKSIFFPDYNRQKLLAIALLAMSLVNATGAQAASDLTLPSRRPTRWLELRQIRGRVTYQRVRTSARAARTGDRIQSAGDRFVTAKQSEAVLAFDDGIGSLRMTEDTIVQVKTLQVGSRGSRITVLSVPRGLARLQIRRFNNLGSRLQIETPAGVAGVRGTDFGVSVSPSGKTVVATQEGSVAASAQGRSVSVNPGLYSLVIPGQAPTPPRPNTGDLSFNVQSLQEVKTSSGSQVRIVARTSPANLVFIETQPIDTNAEGLLDRVVPLPANRRLSILIRAPLANEQTYDLNVEIDPWQLYRQNNLEPAKQGFLSQLQANPNNSDALLGLGYVAYRQNDLDLAKQRFEQVLAIDPNNLDAQIGLARVALRQTQPDAALLQRTERLLQQQLQQNPNNLDALIWLGYVAYRQNNLLLAQQRLEQAQVLAPDNVEAQFGLGIVYLAQQKPVQALTVLEKAASQTSDTMLRQEIEQFIQRARTQAGQ